MEKITIKDIQKAGELLGRMKPPDPLRIWTDELETQEFFSQHGIEVYNYAGRKSLSIFNIPTKTPMIPDIEKPKLFSTRKEADAHYDTLKHAVMLYSKKYGYMVCWLSCKPLDYTLIKSK